MAVVTATDTLPSPEARSLGPDRPPFTDQRAGVGATGHPPRRPLRRLGQQSATPGPRRAEARSDVARGIEVLRDLVGSTPPPPSPAALLALDSEGVCVEVWDLGLPTLGALAHHDVRPGFSLAVPFIGASGSGALATRETHVVWGEAHALPVLRSFATTGTLVLDTTNGRTPLCLLLVADVAEVEWLEGLAAAVAVELRQRARRSEHTLMQRYLEERSDSRHAVVALNEQIIITNAAAARMVGVEEQSRLWEHAQRIVQGRGDAVVTLDVGHGGVFQVHCEPVHEDGKTVGVLMRWRRPTQTQATRIPRDDIELVGLAGSGTKWQAMKRRLAVAAGTSVLLVGEPGSGRSAVARAVATGGGLLEIDFSQPGDLNEHGPRIRAAAQHGDSVLLRNLELVNGAEAARLAAVVQALPATTQVLGTIDVVHGSTAERDSLLDSFGAVVTVPPLRERIEDVPELVRAITARMVAANPHLEGVQWMTDALQALTRLEWPRNVSTLESIVGGVLMQLRTRYVTARDLPAGIAARASGRQLNTLERIEAHAILQAIKDADGNKLVAAESLGIARSTLYRKMRGFGIDLSASTF